MDNQNNAVTAANATQSQTGTAQTRPMGVTAAPLLTVFTPTYNRAHLLPRLYESLCKQSYKDFEWIVIDDGSTDDTTEVVQEFIKENKINIRFHQCANGGKHRAINHGVREARGELFFIVDSDDWLPPFSLEQIVLYYKQVCSDSRFAGVCGLRCYSDGKKVGGEQPFGIIDCNALDIRHRYHIKGDLAEVYRTEVLRNYPFPEYDGEKFCPEALVWNRIAQKYVLRFFYKNIYGCEYQPGGLTDQIVRVRMESPIASMVCYREMLKYNIPLIQKLKSAINYWRFTICSSLPFNQKSKGMHKWLWLWPAGFFMHLCDKKNQK